MADFLDAHENKELLVAAIEKVLPDFAKSCQSKSDVITIRHAEFAPDYDVDECTLLGMAIKYAGLKGKEVRIICPEPSIN